MLIGIDASRANKKERTGTEWYSYYLIRKFSEIDKKNKYILYTKEPLIDDLKDLGDNFYNRVLKWPPKFLWSQLRLSLEMLFRKPDVLFIPAHTIPIIHPNNTVTTCHDIGFEKFPELYAQKRIAGEGLCSKIIGFLVKTFTLGKYSNNELDYHRFSMRLAVKKAKKIITPSKFTADEINRYYKFNKTKPKVIHLGYNTNYKLIEDKKEILDILKKNSINKPFFVFVGRLENKKNILGLIKSFYIFKKKYASSHKLVLIGTKGNGWIKAENFIKEKNIKKDIISLGWVPANEIPLLFNAAEALIFISYYEGFGLPPLEAMACGLPVIASTRGSLPEIIGQAGILVDPNEHEKIADYMQKVVEDENFRKDLARKGVERINNFSWDKCAKETLKVITGS